VEFADNIGGGDAFKARTVMVKDQAEFFGLTRQGEQVVKGILAGRVFGRA